MNDERIDALRQALGDAPDNHVFRKMLASELVLVEQWEEAFEHYELLLDQGQLKDDDLTEVGKRAAEQGRLDLAQACLVRAEELGVVNGMAELRRTVNKNLDTEGVLRLVRHGAGGKSDPVALEAEQVVDFSQVGGLTDVKKGINRMIILPFRRPDLMKKYGRKAGGGVMLYGPPGCGKTLMARATAGECELPFFNVRIEQILDPYMGVSERNLHEAFEQAREKAPCVLFLDELDALAYTRRKHHGNSSRALVDQLLQELDSIGSENDRMLILAATNEPWDVDDALKRPGRFDKLVFIPPPDKAARKEIFNLYLKDVPGSGINVSKLASLTPLFSGADIRALIESAVDEVIDQALDADREVPVTMESFVGPLEETRPTTIDWLMRARDYVTFANQGKKYADIAKFLKSAEVRKCAK